MFLLPQVSHIDLSNNYFDEIPTEALKCDQTKHFNFSNNNVRICHRWRLHVFRCFSRSVFADLQLIIEMTETSPKKAAAAFG